MGLLRALFITSIVFFVSRLIQERFVDTLQSESLKIKLSQYVPLIIVFLIELLL